MDQYQLVALHQAVLPPIPVIVDVHGLEVKQEPVRMMEHGVAMPQHVNVCDMCNNYLVTVVIFFCITIKNIMLWSQY